MTPRTETSPTMSRARLLARTTARAGAVLSASMLLLGLSAIGSSDASAAPLAPGASSAGPVVMNPPTGNGDTDFGLSFPTSQVCPGNGSADGYRWHTFITPTGTDIASFTWSPAGSPQNAPGFTRNLFNAGGSGVRNQFPADSPAGAVTNIPADLEFSGGGVFGPAPAVPIPAGTYTLGIACTRVTDGVIRTEKFWSTNVVLTSDVSAGGAAQVTFAPAAPIVTTTTTTTTVGGTTTTTVAGTTTTTVAGATTTVAGATTTTTAVAASGTVRPTAPTPGGAYTVTYPNCRVGETVTFTQPQSTPTSTTATCALVDSVGTATGSFTAAPTAAGTYTVTMVGSVSASKTASFVISSAAPAVPIVPASQGGSTSGTSSGSIPSTGSSTTSIIVWAILLLGFGRMAILLGRKPKVIS